MCQYLFVVLFLALALAAEAQVIQNNTCVGSAHSCALSSDGTVRCWGENSDGQLGLGDTADRGDESGEMGADLPLVDLDGLAAQIACGDKHTCALLNSGQIKCWGRNVAGQLGLGDTANRGDQPGEMGANLPTVAIGTVRTALKVVAGFDFTCVLLDTQNVKCWGANSFGQLGRGNTVALLSPPTSSIDLVQSNTVTDISAGYFHVCVVFQNKRAQCWGSNDAGALGYGDAFNRGDAANQMGANLPLIQLGANHEVEYIDAGASTSCAILASGVMKCWGLNDDGELGSAPSPGSFVGDNFGEMGDDLPAVDFGSSPTPVSVHLGNAQACTTFLDGSVKCYGDIPSLPSSVPNDALPPVNLGTNLTVTSMDLKNQHACAVLTPDEAVKCWGLGAAGRLGTGDQTNRYHTGGGVGDNLAFVDLALPPTHAPTPVPITGVPTPSPSKPAPSISTAPSSSPSTALPPRDQSTEIIVGIVLVVLLLLFCTCYYWSRKESDRDIRNVRVEQEP